MSKERTWLGQLAENVRLSPEANWKALADLSPVSEILVPGVRILVIGLDPEGSFIGEILKICPEAQIVAVDRDYFVVKKAKRVLPGNVDLKVAHFPNGFDLKGEFDIALAPHLIHLPPLRDAWGIIAGMRQALKLSGGVLGFTAPFLFRKKALNRVSLALNEVQSSFETAKIKGWPGLAFALKV